MDKNNKIIRFVSIGVLLFLFLTTAIIYGLVDYTQLIHDSTIIYNGITQYSSFISPFWEIPIRLLFITLTTYFLIQLMGKETKLKILLPVIPCAFLIYAFINFYYFLSDPKSPLPIVMMARYIISTVIIMILSCVFLAFLKKREAEKTK